MPQIKFAQDAIRDLERLREFLRPKNPLAAKRAGQMIIKAVQVLGRQPHIGRTVEDMPEKYREWVIEFGDSGYVARYRIDADGTDPSHPAPDVVTERGIGIGATEDEIRQKSAKPANVFRKEARMNNCLSNTSAAKMNTFFGHWRGRMVLKRAFSMVSILLRDACYVFPCLPVSVFTIYLR